MTEKLLIVGGGFRGIVASYLAAKAGKRVTLTDRARALGGVMRAEEWKGFFLDKGCHLFSNDSDAECDLLLDLMRGQVVPVEFRYASVTQGRLSEAFAIPDLTSIDPSIRARILQELVAAATAKSAPAATLADVLAQRFGPTAASQLMPIAQKIFRRPAAELDASVFNSTPFRRLALVPDEIGLFLKRLPELDDRLAVSSVADPYRFTRGRAEKRPFRNFYPAERGMNGFCDAAQSRLSELGVSMKLGATLAALEPAEDGVTARFEDGSSEVADRAIWTGDPGALAKLLFGADPLAELSKPVAMALFYFVAPEAALGPYTYVQDFTPDHVLFRVSNAGRYSRQIRADGMTYLCAEVPTERDGELWNRPEEFAPQVWSECVAAGAVTGERWADLSIVKAPVTYRAGLVGLGAATKALAARVAEASKRIEMSGQEHFVRSEIIARAREAA